MQHLLFNPDEFKQCQGPLRGKPLSECATPDAPGTGPKNQRCGTCANRWRFKSGKKQWYKCKAFMGRQLGRAADIKMRWPACSHWRPDADLTGLLTSALIAGFMLPQDLDELAVIADWMEEHNERGAAAVRALLDTNIQPNEFAPF